MISAFPNHNQIIMAPGGSQRLKEDLKKIRNRNAQESRRQKKKDEMFEEMHQRHKKRHQLFLSQQRQLLSELRATPPISIKGLAQPVKDCPNSSNCSRISAIHLMEYRHPQLEKLFEQLEKAGEFTEIPETFDIGDGNKTVLLQQANILKSQEFSALKHRSFDPSSGLLVTPAKSGVEANAHNPAKGRIPPTWWHQVHNKPKKLKL